MRSEIERLEAELLARWAPETLEAYGAALRAAGDPRGELIAIDFVLEHEANGALHAALCEEKQALHVAWFGDHGENIVSKFGFIEDVHEEAEIKLQLIDAIAPYARKLDLWGDPPQSLELVDKLIAAPRPWLRELRVRTFGDQREVLVDNARAQRMIAATPQLRTLRAIGHRVFDDIPHPSVEVVIADGHDALGALRGAGCFPNATTLDLALHPDFSIAREPPPEALRRGLVERAAFPRLVRLDVSRNEPRERTIEPNCLAGRTPIFDVLPMFPILPHVVELRVPSLRSVAQAQQLQALVQRMPQLRSVEVARMYGQLLGTPKHATVPIAVPPPVPWLAGTELRDFDAVLLQSADKTWHRMDLESAYAFCETHYEALAPDVRAAWDELWRAARALGLDATRVEQLEVQHVQAIASSLTVKDADWWQELGAHFASHPSTHVPIRRIDGYERDGEPAPSTPRTIATSDRILEHERALQEHWDLERLAVYADELQQHGDLRGDLIALDLELARNPSSELDFRHGELHDEIFGDSLDIKSKLGLAILDHSMYSQEDDEGFRQLFQGEVARYLGELEVAGTTELVDAALAHVLAAPRPWLRSVTIRAIGMAPTSAIVVAEIPERWPALEAFALDLDEPAPMFRDFAHPRVRRMQITGVRGYETLGGPWPALGELDFAFGTGYEDVPEAPERLFTTARLPALRVLDLSRNEPVGWRFDRDSRHHCRLDAFFAQLGGIDGALAAQLVHVRLPSPRTPTDVAAIQALLDRMPALERLEIARRYPGGPAVELTHPRATLVVPEPSAWPSYDRVVAFAAFAVDKLQIPEGTAILAMEQHYDKLSERGRRAWDELWRFAADPLRAQFKVAADTLYTALDALREVDRWGQPWLEPLAAHLHPLAIAQKTVTVRRAAER